MLQAVLLTETRFSSLLKLQKVPQTIQRNLFICFSQVDTKLKHSENVYPFSLVAIVNSTL